MKPKLLILLLCLLQGVQAVAQGIGLESASRIVLNAAALQSQPLSLSPVFNAHDRFNLSAFAHPVAEQAQQPSLLLRKKATVPAYVYKNLGILMRGIDTHAAQSSNHSVVLHFNSGTLGGGMPPYDRPFGAFANPAWPSDAPFRIYLPSRYGCARVNERQGCYFPSSSIYSPAYRINPFLH